MDVARIPCLGGAVRVRVIYAGADINIGHHLNYKKTFNAGSFLIGQFVGRKKQTSENSVGVSVYQG